MKPQVQALLHKARESQSAAGTLLRERYADFAASRLYYAMFYAAQALLLERGLVYSSHAAVIAAFGREFAKTGALDSRYHRYLIDAQDSRNQGDYGTGPGLTAAQVADLAVWTEDFLAAAEAILSGSAI